jgi:hypothetical protein
LERAIVGWRNTLVCGRNTSLMRVLRVIDDIYLYMYLCIHTYIV